MNSCSENGIHIKTNEGNAEHGIDDDLADLNLLKLLHTKKLYNFLLFIVMCFSIPSKYDKL